jgi:thiol-disulfide isomerase/thioredoxin
MYFSFIINNLQKGKVRDVILYDLMSKAISQVLDSAKRERLLTNFIYTVSQSSLQQKLITGNATMNHLQPGKPAINFTGEAVTTNNIQLTDFRGRLVVIDVWATWCGPCQKESPYFERLAEEYGGKQIAFVSVSIDEERNRWQSDVSQRSQLVLQLWANAKNAESFSRDYNIEFIPRFMLISPDGKILNAQMPPPSDPRFEAILQQEISFSTTF